MKTLFRDVLFGIILFLIGVTLIVYAVNLMMG